MMRHTLYFTMSSEGLYVAWLNDQMADGRTFIAGEQLTLADILLFCFLAFGQTVGQPFDESLSHVKAWFDRMAARPSASA